MNRKIFLVLLSLMFVTSCISYSNEGGMPYTKTNAIEKGVTTRSWLYDHLGEPVSIHATRRGSDIWHYRFTAKERTKVSFLLLFNVSSKRESTRDLYLELMDGVVEDYWQE